MSIVAFGSPYLLGASKEMNIKVSGLQTTHLSLVRNTFPSGHPPRVQVSANNDRLGVLRRNMPTGLVVEPSADGKPPISFPLRGYLMEEGIIILAEST